MRFFFFFLFPSPQQDVEARSTQPLPNSVGGYSQPQFEIDGIDEDSSSGFDEISTRLYGEARSMPGFSELGVGDESKSGTSVIYTFQPILELLLPKRCIGTPKPNGEFIPFFFFFKRRI